MLQENQTLMNIIGVTRPLIELVVSIAGPVIVTWLSLKLATVLNIKADKDKTDLESSLRDALHASATNAITYASKQLGVDLSADKTTAGWQPSVTTAQVIQTAADYVKDKNPETLTKLNVSDSQLKDILLTKVPT